MGKDGTKNCEVKFERQIIAGTFGKVDAMSEILTEYLKRLEEQQECVNELIKNQRQMLKDGKAAKHLQSLKQSAAKVFCYPSPNPCMDGCLQHARASCIKG